MNRRDLFKRAAALGIVVATPTLWALDQTMLGSGTGEYVDVVDNWTPANIDSLQGWWVATSEYILVNPLTGEERHKIERYFHEKYSYPRL